MSLILKCEHKVLVLNLGPEGGGREGGGSHIHQIEPNTREE